MDKNKTYFFVRGYMRSGTNWVGNLLNLHPDIAVTGEYHLHRLYEGFDRISNPKRNPYALLMGSDYRLKATREFERLVRRLIELGSQECKRPEAKFLGARTPAPLARLVIRNAKRIHIVRDGRDCLVSSTFHYLRLSGEYPFENHPKMMEKRRKFKENPDTFHQNPEQLFDDEPWVRSRIRSWANRLHSDRAVIDRRKDQVFSTTYEALHADTDNVRRQMYAFIGADPDLAESLTNQTSAGFEQEDLMSHYRKGIVGDWKKYFSTEVGRWFVEESKKALEIAGYEKDDSWVKNCQI